MLAYFDISKLAACILKHVYYNVYIYMDVYDAMKRIHRPYYTEYSKKTFGN